MDKLTSDNERYQLLIETHRKRLILLREQAAKFGIYVPPYILIDIEETEQELERLGSNPDEDLRAEPLQVTQAVLNYYLYVSTSKVNMLYRQIQSYPQHNIDD